MGTLVEPYDMENGNLVS